MSLNLTRVNEPARPLSAKEREILAFLLTVETAGIEELRRQVDHALAIPWDCGCASIDLVVDREAVPPSSISVGAAIESRSKRKDDPRRLLDLRLWVDDGFLAGVEIVDHAEPHGKLSRVFPSPSDFDPPFMRDEAS